MHHCKIKYGILYDDNGESIRISSLNKRFKMCFWFSISFSKHLPSSRQKDFVSTSFSWSQNYSISRGIL